MENFHFVWEAFTLYVKDNDKGQSYITFLYLQVYEISIFPPKHSSRRQKKSFIATL